MAKSGKSIIRTLLDFNKNLDKLVGTKPAPKKGKK